MTSVTVGLYIAIAVVAVFGLLKGLRKGLYKSLIDLGATIISLILSIILAKLISKSALDEETILSAIDSLMQSSPDMVESLTPIKDTLVGLSNDSNAIGMMLAFPVIILAPIIYMLIYLIVSTILKIIA
ncbi:MAG: hypothetical protein J6A54_04560, partial [Clostridia bacterium]|nr:hypothetical protein [Clostridia bacterium]